MVIDKLFRKKAPHPLFGKHGLLNHKVTSLGNAGEFLTWKNYFSSVCITGINGSGKTSGPGARIALDLLSHSDRAGGLFLCVKADERARLVKLINMAGRQKDLVVISHENKLKVNALEYALRYQSGNEPNYAQAVDVLMEVLTLAENQQAGGSSGGENERYWDKSLRLLLSRLMMLLHLSGETISIENMRRLMVSSFSESDLERYSLLLKAIRTTEGKDQAEAITEYDEWCKSSYFLNCFDRVDTLRDLNKEQLNIVQLIGSFFFTEWLTLSDRTKSIIVSSAVGLFEPFLSGILKSHFSSEMSAEVLPERCFKEGAIVIVDVPVKTHGISAVFANGLYKKIFQISMERRVIEQERKPRPVFCYIDEYHFLVNAHSDAKFLSSCRSCMVANVFITQSFKSLNVSMGKSQSDDKTKALLANIGTTIACANTCRDTNILISELIGKAFIRTNSSSFDSNINASQSYSEQLHYIVPPEHFLTLKNGSKENKYKVETIVCCSSKKWRTGESFLEVTWDQRMSKSGLISHLKTLF